MNLEALTNYTSQILRNNENIVILIFRLWFSCFDFSFT